MTTQQYRYDKEYYVREMSQRWRDFRECVGRSDEYTIEDVKDAFIAAIISAFGKLVPAALEEAAKELIRTPESEI